MDSTLQTRKAYQNHRDNQRERILEAAQELFIGSGIDSVTLAAIARSARLSRVTLYEYFPDKHEIAWAVFQKVVADVSGSLGVNAGQETSSGYQQLEAFFEARLGLLAAYPDHLRYIAVFNFLYAREGGGARMRSLLEQALPGYYGLPADWIRSGIADGSIRPDVNADLCAAAIFNLLSGIDARFSLMVSVVQEEYGYGVIEMYREICRNFLRGIRAE